MQEDKKNKGHSRDSTMSFLSPRNMNAGSYEGLVADSWSFAPPEYNKRARKGPKVPISTPLKISLKAFHRKNIFGLEDKPRT